jgi:hypothetical protein
MRKFLGLVGSKRRIISLDTVLVMNNLAPLTGVEKNVPYKPEPCLF